jgi:hypothetical protein
MTNEIKLLRLSLRLTLNAIEDYNASNQDFHYAIQKVSNHPYYVAFRRLGESNQSAMKFAETFMHLYNSLVGVNFKPCTFEPLTKHTKIKYPEDITELKQYLEKAQGDLELVEKKSGELRVKYYNIITEFNKAVSYGAAIIKLTERWVN